jgi:sialate O-acetylesterase
MEVDMEWVRAHFANEFLRPADPLLRQCKVDEAHDFEGIRRDHESGSARWTGCSARTLGGFSALAYFMGRRLRETLNVPVGLVNVSVGGSPIESWMSAESLVAFPQALAELEPYLSEGLQHSNAVAARKSRESLAAIEQWYERLDRDAHDAEVISETGHNPSATRGKWFPLKVPGWFRSQDALVDFAGLLYLRARVSVPPAAACAPAALHLGTIVDADVTYVNGQAVGHSDYQYLPRDYDIPAGVLRGGENEILISVVCERGTGRVTPGKPLRLVVGDWDCDLSTPATQWEARLAVRARCDCPVEDFVRWRPTVLYNAMLAPCFPMTLSSVVWYQGESNTERPASYRALLESLVTQWRARWKEAAHVERLPFFVVQLPEFSIDVTDGGAGWDEVRKAQAEVASRTPGVSLVIGKGCGEWNDLHPWNKRTLGERVAAAMLGGADAETSDHRLD